MIMASNHGIAVPLVPEHSNTDVTAKVSRKRKRTSTRQSSSTNMNRSIASSLDIATGMHVQTSTVILMDRNLPTPEQKFAYFSKDLVTIRDPYPNHQAPDAEICQEVHDRLVLLHGPQVAPKDVPAPSLDKAGCGEVPTVIDAMLRTRISAGTTMKNANSAIQNLAKVFGSRKFGAAKESVDWEAIHASDTSRLAAAIQCGGLGNLKAADIKYALQMVHNENILVRDALLAEKDTGITAKVSRTADLTQEQKILELDRLKETLLSLEHVKDMETVPAIKYMMQFPGIGIKTAACVALFCLQRPSFAVDTHVHRLCKWLGWVPENGKPTEVKVYAHCENRIPDRLKYSLHQLLLLHGKSCGRCKASTLEGSALWNSATCPLEDLLKRVKTKRKGKLDTADAETEQDLNGEDENED